MNAAMNVVFIGGGNMADALIGGQLKSGLSASRRRASPLTSTPRSWPAEKPLFSSPPISASAMLPPPMNTTFMATFTRPA